MKGKQGRCKTLSDSTVTRKKEILPHITPHPHAPSSKQRGAMEKITPAWLIWVMVVNWGHCTRKIPEGGREGRVKHWKRWGESQRV